MGAPQRHKDAAQTPDAFSAALRARTGEVSDTRRMVTFLYLLMRDVLPLGVVAEMHREAMDATQITMQVTGGRDANRVLARLVKSCPIRTHLFISRVLGRVEDLEPILSQLSPDDDVECAFTNGHLARYAQLIADDITDGGTQEEQEPVAHG